MNEKNNINEVNDLLLGGDGAANVLEKLAESLKTRVIRAAMQMNDHADKKDLPRNRVNYGVMIEALRVLRELCYDTDSAVWADGDFLICEKITINGKAAFMR